VPTKVGVNITLIVQLPPAARPAPPIGQVLDLANTPGFAPPNERLLITSGANPVLDNVTVLAALVTFNGELNDSEVGETLAIGARTVPVRDTD